MKKTCIIILILIVACKAQAQTKFEYCQVFVATLLKKVPKTEYKAGETMVAVTYQGGKEVDLVKEGKIPAPQLGESPILNMMNYLGNEGWILSSINDKTLPGGFMVNPVSIFYFRRPKP